MERQMVPDRHVLVAGLELSLPHVVSHGLAALFLVVPDQVAELFDPIDVLGELLEVIQENLPEHADVLRGCLRLVVFRERLPRLSTFYLWHVLQPSLRFSTRAPACSTAAVGSTPARTERGSRTSCPQ